MPGDASPEMPEEGARDRDERLQAELQQCVDELAGLRERRHAEQTRTTIKDNYVVNGPGVYTFTGTPRAICPDLLSIRDIGEADGWRGRVVRGFFAVLRKVTGL